MDKQVRILNVEDSERDSALLTRHIRAAGYDLFLQRVDSEEAMKAALLEEEWDLILCDYSLARFSAIAALTVLRASNIDLPFIVISGTVDEEIAVQTLLIGANDYIPKGNLTRLVPAIHREMRKAENGRAMRNAEQALKASEAELRALFAAMNDVIMVFDHEGHHLKVAPTNPKNVYSRGTNRIGKTLHEIYPPEVADFILANIQTCLDESRTLHVEYTLSIEGVDVWFDGTVTPMTDSSVIWVARDVSECKDSEKQLRLQASALNAAANAIVITSIDGKIVWVNSAFTTITGYTLDEVKGKNPRILRSGEHDTAFYKDMWDTILAGQVWQGELVNRRRDRTTYFEYQTITPVLNGNGEITHFVAVKQDISERKRLEKNILESAERLQLAVQSSNVGLWDWNIATNQAQFSPEWKSQLGYKPDEIENDFSEWETRLHPDDLAPTLDRLNDYLARPQGFHQGEFRMRHKDGSWRSIYSQGEAFLDAAGKPERMVGCHLDLTDRKNVEAAREAAEENYRGIFENAVEGLFQSTIEGRFISANSTMARILGFDSPAELIELRTDIGRQHYVDPESRTQLSAILENDGVAVAYECEVYKKDGTKIWTQEKIRTIRGTDGVISHYEGSLEDITERKSLEDQFRQAQKMEAVGVMAGGIAHDFNNLLTAINGYSDLTLRKMQADDPLRPNIEQVKDAGSRAAELTSQLLAFSRKQVLKPVVHNLNAVIGTIEKMLKRIIRENIELRTVLDPTLGNIKADPGQVEQVIVNLAVNARDAMPDGGTLKIETENVYLDNEYISQKLAIEPGPFVRMTITDTGCGMDAATQQRIFEPFFTTKEVGKGTGLGLSMVYGIVKQSGGDIMVCSEPGHGTTFKIYLPRVEEGVERPKWHDGGSETDRGTETILLVEDEAVVRRLVYDILTGNGYTVLEAANGKTALEICSSYDGRIDMMLTDVIMPSMSGVELKQAVAALLPDIKVMFMSGYTDDAVADRGVLDADAAFIEKPFTPDALSRQVRKVLQG
ncbi:MAG: PAS domain S-box protein [Pyrinomonadaceae bacterium]